MNLFGVMQISSSGLTAERIRAEVVTANMANAETTRTPEGGPYRRKQVVFETSHMSGARFTRLSAGEGVRVTTVLEDPTEPLQRFEPGHPDADPQGFVSYPAINPIEEMVDLMGAVRAYQLNAAAVTASKQMIQQSIDILK
jgi:flagellar basal-body rod protein FlgC